MKKMVNGSLVEMTDDEIAEFNASQNKSIWLENRLSEYPSFDECLHAILDNNLDSIQTKRAAVKAKYPKE
tara:strand:+ start:742 stop:951 length:210 start_codon:yes stop_codon:yes gene_type:complete